MKRFTETKKWEDAWFRELAPENKVVWMFLCDVCDGAGFWEVQIDWLEFHTKVHGVTEESLRHLSQNVIIRDGVMWLLNFIPFQYPTGLNIKCRPHLPIIRSLEVHAESFPEVQDYIDQANSGLPFNAGCVKRSNISSNLRFEILTRDNFSCRYCGRKSPEVALEVDHIVPVAKGGQNDKGNLVTACYSCNQGKRADSLYDSLSDSLSNTHKEKDKDKEKEMDSEGIGVLLATEALNRLFGRRNSTAWSSKELRALQDLRRRAEFPSELKEIEAYYLSGSKYLRQDLLTLLNNWPGELDRARRTYKPAIKLRSAPEARA